MTKIVMIQKRAIKLECKRCSHRWLYAGANNYMVSCPHCGTKIGIKKLLHRIELEEGEGVSFNQSVEMKENTKTSKDSD